MRIVRILLRVVGFKLLASSLIKLLLAGGYNFRTDVKKKLATWAIKGTILLFMIGLLQCGILFGLGALALYLSTLLGSTYQGVLGVAGACVALSLVLLLLSRLWR